MKKTPYIAKVYLLLAAFLIALPTIGTSYYPGQQGRFLIASEKIRGEPFGESVIYISHHSIFGAFGVIVNKPLDSEKLVQLNPDLQLPKDFPLLKMGGPVDFPHKAYAFYSELSKDVIIEDNRAQDMSVADVINSVESYPQSQVFLGYSGWGPLQLEIELLRGTWTIIEAPAETMFEQEDMSDMWYRLKQQRAPDHYIDQKI